MTNREVMTPEQARTFNGVSHANAAALFAAAHERGCGCEPYVDWFTYGRWQAQGYQVQRGEHGVRLPTIVHSEDDEGNERRWARSSVVFCRCQVKPIGE